MNIEALQRHRVNRVINFARTHASDALTLDDFAGVACLSRYHFLRIFAEHCRETPIEFLSRMRLEQSISNLIYSPGIPITSVALGAGFSSSQAFSGAFRRKFGISPRGFRAANTWYIKEFPKNQYVVSHLMSKLPALASDDPQSMAVELRSIPETRLAYIRHRGPYYYRSEARKSTFVKLIDWAKRQGYWQEDTAIIGVCPDNPAVTPPQYCQYDAGIAVGDGVDEDDTVSIQNLPETTLATLEAPDSPIASREAWRWLISHWLPRSGMSVARHAYYEIRKPNVGDPSHAATRTLLCLPVSAGKSNSARENPSAQIPSVHNFVPYGTDDSTGGSERN